jgi:hypothetical protein
MKLADVLDAQDLAHEDVDVPEWNGALRMVQLDAAATMDMTIAMGQDPKNGMYILVAFTARDVESGEWVFPLSGDDDARKEQLAGYVAALRKKNFQVLSRLQKAALRVNNMLRTKAPNEIKNA